LESSYTASPNSCGDGVYVSRSFGTSVVRTNTYHLGGLLSNTGGLIAADQFLLKEPAAITAIKWCGFFQDPIVLSNGGSTELKFRISFYDDGLGVPTRQLSQQDVLVRVRDTGVRTRLPDKSPVVYEFVAASLRPVALTPGKTVWISISAVDSPGLWLWSRSFSSLTDTLSVKDESRSQSQPLDWQSNGKFGQLAFTLFTGPIDNVPMSRPEPPPRASLPAASLPRPLTSGSTERPVTIAGRSEPRYTEFARRARVKGSGFELPCEEGWQPKYYRCR
jgi:hypothetical protein